MVGLYEEAEKPEHPLEYLKSQISAAVEDSTANTAQLSSQLQSSVQEVAVLRDENQKLKERIRVLEQKLGISKELSEKVSDLISNDLHWPG